MMALSATALAQPRAYPPLANAPAFTVAAATALPMEGMACLGDATLLVPWVAWQRWGPVRADAIDRDDPG